ncbi:Uu.00g096140.m01.CDS01 [Anthostomella pinea]|uniref:Uu.00g096140.m01.CDS01 n=1 Tax=Anthostomella pinea TaxID=933095 RepID=A0AAI8VC48_9PEZI|nr:Uu.00g096140.m01.CDS01 [Anthostomella pinea]
MYAFTLEGEYWKNCKHCWKACQQCLHKAVDAGYAKVHCTKHKVFAKCTFDYEPLGRGPSWDLAAANNSITNANGSTTRRAS